MRKAGRFHANNRQTVSILIGYNLPWAVWTLFAVFQAVSGGVHVLRCPIHALLGWCPGCGMTTAYVALLREGRITSPWSALILTGFLANFLWSLHLIRNKYHVRVERNTWKNREGQRACKSKGERG